MDDSYFSLNRWYWVMFARGLYVTYELIVCQAAFLPRKAIHLREVVRP